MKDQTGRTRSRTGRELENASSMPALPLTELLHVALSLRSNRFHLAHPVGNLGRSPEELGLAESELLRFRNELFACASVLAPAHREQRRSACMTSHSPVKPRRPPSRIPHAGSLIAQARLGTRHSP